MSDSAGSAAYQSSLAIEFRAPWWLFAQRLLLPLVVFTSFAAFDWSDGDHSTAWVVGSMFLVGAIGTVWQARRFRVELHPDRLVVVNLRRHEVAWAAIRSIDPGRNTRWTQRPVTVLGPGGPVGLIALQAGWPFGRSHGQGAFDLVTRWWAERRGPDWRPGGPSFTPYASPYPGGNTFARRPGAPGNP